MDRTKVKMMREDIEANLKSLEEKYNVKLMMGSASFSTSDCNFKVEFADVSEDGEVQSKEIRDFKMFHANYGFQADDLGKRFTMRGTSYEITGLSTRKPKYPVLAKRVKDNAPFKFQKTQVLQALGRE